MATLFDLPHSRTSDPASSFEAGDIAKLNRPELYHAILCAMVRMNAIGFDNRVTAHEIDALGGISIGHQYICRCLPEMAVKGLISRGDGDKAKLCRIINRKTLAYWVER